MCRRYVLTHSMDEISRRFGLHETQPSLPFELEPRFNIAPLQSVPVVMRDASGALRLERMRWGLVPFWASDPEVGQRLVNARSESVAEKPAFRSALKQRRCIIPASGFFDWAGQGEAGVRLHVHPRDGELLGLAGLWEEWRGADGLVLRTCTIITTEANRLLAPFSGRMPAILRRGDEALWLDSAQTEAAAFKRVLKPYSSRQLEVHAVGRAASFAPGDRGSLTPLANDREIVASFGGTAQKRVARLFPATRHLQRDFVGLDGKVFFRTRSWTRQDLTRWHPVVDVEDGHVFCDCPDFRFRHDPQARAVGDEPKVSTPQFWCKHLERAVRNCHRHGELAALST